MKYEEITLKKKIRPSILPILVAGIVLPASICLWMLNYLTSVIGKKSIAPEWETEGLLVLIIKPNLSKTLYKWILNHFIVIYNNKKTTIIWITGVSPSRWLLSIAAPALIVYRGLLKKSLDPSGAILGEVFLIYTNPCINCSHLFKQLRTIIKV